MKSMTFALALVLAVFLAAGGCGSGAIEGPLGADDTSVTVDPGSTGQTTSKSVPDGETQKTRYRFSLPDGPTALNVYEGAIYSPLMRGDCSEAQRQLELNRANLSSNNRQTLFQAGIFVCRQDLAAARSEFAQVSEEDWDVWMPCEVYRAVGSVIRQKPKSAFGTCPPPPPLPTPDPLETPDPVETSDPLETPGAGEGGDSAGGRAPEGGEGS